MKVLLVTIIYSIAGPSVGASVQGTDILDVNYYEPFIDAYDESTVNLHSGSDVSYLKLYDISNAYVLGGELAWLQLFDVSSAEIYNTDLSWLGLNENATVNIYGSNFEYSNGHLSGFWADGTQFSFWALNMDNGTGMFMLPTNIMPAGIHLNEVPVPGAVFLFVTGLITLLGFKHNLS
ncbi:MAG: hypothetical protein GY777_28725 [Candidatus Brocadiaceae bacterium]|nr:hypothetical protein [Candidatus Brocadiaceae bacterium]